MHKILGQVDILGSPIVLGSNIFEGLATFFKEPLKARTPKQFARGIVKGSLALVKFSAFGFLEAIGKVRHPGSQLWPFLLSRPSDSEKKRDTLFQSSHHH